MCDFSLVLILLSAGLNSEGLPWSINVTQIYQEPPGSDMVIRCSFTYPEEHHTEDVQVYWKKPGTSVCSKNDKDKQAFISHTNATCVDDHYRGRTKLIGNQREGNCSLAISNVTRNEKNIYLRVFAKNQNYSFIKNFVSIEIKGNPTVTSILDTMLVMTEEPPNDSKTIYAAIFAPVAALVLLVAGILVAVKYKRSQTFTREESGYYANCSRSSPHPAEGKPPGMKVKEALTEQKVIEEPVYINLEAPRTEMQQDHVDHVYGNVDY